MWIKYQLYGLVFLFLPFSYNYTMHQSFELSDKILCATFIGEDKVATGTKNGCQIFTLKDNQITCEQQVFSHAVDNLTANKNQTLLASTCANQSITYIYDHLTEKMQRKLHIINLHPQASNIFLENNQLLVFDSSNIYLNGKLGGIKSLARLDWLERVDPSISHHPVENLFLCYSETSLYLAEYHHDASPYSIKISAYATQLERANFLIDYKQALFNSSGNTIAIRNDCGDVLLHSFKYKGVHNYSLTNPKLIGSEKDSYINMCFHPYKPNLLAMLTDNGTIQCWNVKTNECIIEIRLSATNTSIGVLSSLVKGIRAYFSPNISSLSFDMQGDKLLATMDNECFVIKDIALRLLNTNRNFTQYKVIYELSKRHHAPREIRWFLMRLLLLSLGNKINL